MQKTHEYRREWSLTITQPHRTPKAVPCLPKDSGNVVWRDGSTIKEQTHNQKYKIVGMED